MCKHLCFLIVQKMVEWQKPLFWAVLALPLEKRVWANEIAQVTSPYLKIISAKFEHNPLSNLAGYHMHARMHAHTP